jgi:phage terminase large subunit GpA-like protein
VHGRNEAERPGEIGADGCTENAIAQPLDRTYEDLAERPGHPGNGAVAARTSPLGFAKGNGMRHLHLKCRSDRSNRLPFKLVASFKGIAGFTLNGIYNVWARSPLWSRNFSTPNTSPGSATTNRSIPGPTTSSARPGRRRPSASPPSRSWRRRRTTDRIHPTPVLYLTAGIDVQDDRLEIEVVGWRATTRDEPEESWGIEDIVLYRGKETEEDKDAGQGRCGLHKVWDELNELLKRAFTTQDGRALRISAACVDSGGHRTDEVYRFCTRRVSRHIYAVKGIDGPGQVWPRRASYSRKFKGNPLWTIHVDTAKDAIYGSLRVGDPGPGYCHFPISYELEYFQQLISESVRTRFKNGHPFRYWYKPEGVRNEALDRRVYALAALRSRSVPWEILVRSSPAPPPSEKPDGDPSKPPPDRLPPLIPPPPGQRRGVRFRVR